MTLIGYLPKEPWAFLILAIGLAMLATIGDTIHHGFHVEEALTNVGVGFLGTAGGYGLAKLAGAF